MLRAVSALVAFVLSAGIGADLASAQAPGGRLKSIAASKVIKIAYRADATPFSFVNEKKEPVGYSIDLCKQVVASLDRQFGIQGLKIEWVPVTTQTRFEVVASGKADLECGSSTVTLGRMKVVDFSNYIFVESTGIIVRVDSGVTSLKDIAGKRIAVIAGTSNETAMVLRNKQIQLNAIVVPMKSSDDVTAALDSGAVDGFASDKMLLLGTRFKGNQRLRLLPDDLSIEPYGIALPRGDWELRLAVNTALAQIFRGAEIKKIFDYWFDHLGAPPSTTLLAVYLFGALSE